MALHIAASILFDAYYRVGTARQGRGRGGFDAQP